VSEIRPIPQTFRVRPLVPCEGKECAKKAVCAHYYARALKGRSPVPRLCAFGEEEPELMGVSDTTLPESKP
jgi:hypothetical protein